MIAVRKTQAGGYHAACMRAVFAACKAQGIDDDMRRDIVREVTGKASLKDCSSAEIGKVLDRLNRRRGEPVSALASEWRFVFRAAASRQPYLKKIYRLAEALGQMQTPPVKVMPKHYIEGIASQMAGIKGHDNVELLLEFSDEATLIKIIAALDTHIRRQVAGCGRRMTVAPACSPLGQTHRSAPASP
ncbi:MAG: regulatory protein GemA [Betaproteobacteria bacterium]|nr:regulatory protein GemA [Betaproteobacteria bacterium]